MASDKTLGPELSIQYFAIKSLDSIIKGVSYNFTSENDYKKITSLEESQLVYWGEIIQRLHICGVTSIKRIKKWFDSIIISYNNDNYYSFSASIRGLLEACSDSFYTISKISYPIAEHHSHINNALNGKAKVPLFAEEVENELIHYMFGRKLKEAEKRSEENSHNAKRVREYLNSIDDNDVIALYEELCQISHPSKTSLVPFLFSQNAQSLYFHTHSIDNELNENILARHKGAIKKAIDLGIGPSLITLKLINRFESAFVDSLRTDDTVFKIIEDNNIYKTIFDKVDKSRTVPWNCITN